MFDHYSRDLFIKRIEKRLEVFFTRHETAVNRFKRMANLAAFCLLWPYSSLLSYALLVTAVLGIWYGFASVMGLEVPEGNFFQAILTYYKQPTLRTVINIGFLFLIAFWIFMVRSYYRVFYGFLEMIVGAIIGSSVNVNDPDQKVVLLTLASGVYVMVRGLDNIDKGVSDEGPGADVLRYFPLYLRNWIESGKDLSVSEVLDPANWRTHAEKDTAKDTHLNSPEDQTHGKP